MEAARALLRMALHERNLDFAERLCLDALEDRRPEVKTAAIQSLGHLARIHHALANAAVVDHLKKLQQDPAWSGLAEDALDDILTFVPSQSRAN